MSEPRPVFCSLVLPCYNERPNLAPLALAFAEALAGLPWAAEFELILVDNGSSDGTAAELAGLLPRYPFLRSVRVERNRGYGFGITAGLKAARGLYVGWAHADRQYAPAELLAAAGSLRAAGGERLFLKGLRSARPAADAFFTAAMGLFASLLFGRRLYDINAQPTLFHRSLLAHWAQAPEDFSLDLFAFVQALRLGFAVRRVPVTLLPRGAGVSSWNSGFGLLSRLRVGARTARSAWRLKRVIF